MNEAKQLAEREARAAALGLPLWQYEAAQAVDDATLADLRADLRRGNPATFGNPLPEPPQSSEEMQRKLAEQEAQRVGMEYRRELADLNDFIRTRSYPFTEEAVAEMHRELREKHFGGKP